MSDVWDEANRELKINPTELGRESIRNPELFCNWLKRLSSEAKSLRALNREQKTIYRQKWEYYSGKADPSVYKDKPFNLKLLKQDIPTYIDADPDMMAIREKIEEQQAVVHDLEQVVAAIKSRQWDIRNAIEFLKFTQGSNIV